MSLKKVTVPDSILIRWTDDNKIGSQFVSITHIMEDDVIMPGQSRVNDPELLTQERLAEVLSTADASALIRVEVLEQEVFERDQQITKLEEAVGASNMLIEQMRTEGAQTINQYNELVEVHSAVTAQNVQMQDQLAQLLPDFQELQGDRDALEAERDRLRTEVTRLEALVEQYENEKFEAERPTESVDESAELPNDQPTDAPVAGEDYEFKS